MGGVKHFGLHPDPENPLSIAGAQLAQDKLVGETLGLPKGAHVLECGCGEGSASIVLAQEYGYRTEGIDLLPMNIRRAKRAARRAGTDSHFQVGSYMQLPFEDNTFDGVFAIETLVHAPNAGAALAELHRVLKPGGVLAFCEYSMLPRRDMSKRGATIMTNVNTYASMPALETFPNGSFPKLLRAASFADITVRDRTRNFLPTLKIFHDRAARGMTLIRRLHLEKRFINAYSAYEIYESELRGEHLVRYNLVRARADK